MTRLARMGYQPEIKDACRPRFVQILTTVFEQGTKEGSFRPLDATDLSRMFLGCLLEMFDLQAGGAPENDVKRFAGTLIDASSTEFIPGRDLLAAKRVSIRRIRSVHLGGPHVSPLRKIGEEIIIGRVTCVRIVRMCGNRVFLAD